MSSFKTKFEAFWTSLGEDCPYELPEEIKPYLKKALKVAGFNQIQSTQTTQKAVVQTQTKKLSGYNIFLKEKMAQLKAESVPSGQRMEEARQMWKALDEKKKAEWKIKADQSNGPATSKKTRRPNGYNLFMKAKMVELKADSSIPASGRMAEIGKMWKSLSEEEKGEWKEKAKA